MRAVRDLLVGSAPPQPIDIFYNGDTDVDSVTKRYRGSLAKFMMYTGDIDHGNCFVTWAGETTVDENICGILEEEQGITGNYLPDDATYGMARKKMTPIGPMTVLEAEYAQADPSGTAIYDTGATCAVGSEEFTISITTADTLIGGWIYMINGASAGRLWYIDDNETTYAELDSAATEAVAATDDFLVIMPPVGMTLVEFDAHYVNLLSEVDDGARSNFIIGLDTYISAPGIPKQPLNRTSHHDLVIANARFYHQFCIGGNDSGIGNAWANGLYA